VRGMISGRVAAILMLPFVLAVMIVFDLFDSI
jgi:hypothetical protein